MVRNAISCILGGKVLWYHSAHWRFGFCPLKSPIVLEVSYEYNGLPTVKMHEAIQWLEEWREKKGLTEMRDLAARGAAIHFWNAQTGEEVHQ